MNNGFILTARQAKHLNKAIDILRKEVVMAPRMARKDADDLRKFIHMARALTWISPNERNHYLAAIDEVFEPKHDDVLVGSIVQSNGEGKEDDA